MKEKRIGREGEGKREGCRDKGLGRWGGKIGVRNNYLLTLFRVLQGRTGNFREIHFLKGFREFFVNISTRALARVEMLTKNSRNPERKWISLKFSVLHM